MAEIANIVFEYIEGKANSSKGKLGEADIFPHVYSKINVKNDSGYTVRITDIASAIPSKVNNGIRKHNAILTIQIYVRVLPPMDTDAELQARSCCDELADEVITEIFADDSFADTTGSICNSVITAMANDWGKVGDVKHALTFLLIKVNPRDM